MGEGVGELPRPELPVCSNAPGATGSEDALQREIANIGTKCRHYRRSGLLRFSAFWHMADLAVIK